MGYGLAPNLSIILTPLLWTSSNPLMPNHNAVTLTIHHSHSHCVFLSSERNMDPLFLVSVLFCSPSLAYIYIFFSFLFIYSVVLFYFHFFLLRCTKKASKFLLCVGTFSSSFWTSLWDALSPYLSSPDILLIGTCCMLSGVGLQNVLDVLSAQIPSKETDTSRVSPSLLDC